MLEGDLQGTQKELEAANTYYEKLLSFGWVEAEKGGFDVNFAVAWVELCGVLLGLIGFFLG